MLKILIKFFPALIPIITYFIWILFLREITLLRKTRNDLENQKKPKVVSMEKKYTIINDRKFIISIILSFTILIAMFIFLVFGSLQNKGDRYVPAKYEDGKLIPAQKIIDEEN